MKIERSFEITESQQSAETAKPAFRCPECITLPNQKLREWVDCCSCVWAKYEPSQAAYRCQRWGDVDPRQGCLKGVER